MRDTSFLTGKRRHRKYIPVKGTRYYPLTLLVLLVRVCWGEGKALGSKEGKAF
jgi:hypothetical protein